MTLLILYVGSLLLVGVFCNTILRGTKHGPTKDVSSSNRIENGWMPNRSERYLWRCGVAPSQVPVGNENQQVVQQQYQQQVMVPVSQSVQGPMPVYYSVITPTQQNSTR